MTQLFYRQTMKTSSRISLQFTLRIAVISWILLWILNTVFMFWWIRSETQNVTQYVVLKNLQPHNPFTDSFQRQERVLAFPENAFSPNDFPTFWWIKRLRFFDARWWIVWKSGKYFVLFDVSQNINRQLWLLSISAVSRFTVLLTSFIFGRLFVQRSLRDLRTLAKNIRNRDVTKTNWSLIFWHLPANDEINSIARSIENLESRIQWYYTNLRQFVWNVSHELKTPLMVMRSELDITHRTKNYEELVKNIGNSVWDMQAMVDTLLILTRLQSQDTIKKEKINLYDITQDTAWNLQKKHHHKQMHIHIHDKQQHQQYEANESLIKMLLTNIIDNAWKYAPEKSNIDIHITKDSITVENVWTISKEIIENMRTPFWQADKNRGDGVWIGLSLVKEIIRLHNWDIGYTSTENKVMCTIYFDKTST